MFVLFLLEAVNMKILKIEINGFRSLKNVSFAPAGLNVIIGPNGTGKFN